VNDEEMNKNNEGIKKTISNAFDLKNAMIENE